MFLEARKFFFIKIVLVYCCTIARLEKKQPVKSVQLVVRIV